MTREQILIKRVSPDLPIIVYPEKAILPMLKENFQDESINLKTEMEIHQLFDAREEGGITCELRRKGHQDENLDQAFLCSITHFRLKRGEPHYPELEKYRIKRIRWLQRQNKNRFF